MKVGRSIQKYCTSGLSRSRYSTLQESKPMATMNLLRPRGLDAEGGSCDSRVLLLLLVSKLLDCSNSC
jgi:hypothetical protein